MGGVKADGLRSDEFSLVQTEICVERCISVGICGFRECQISLSPP